MNRWGEMESERDEERWRKRRVRLRRVFPHLYRLLFDSHDQLIEVSLSWCEGPRHRPGPCDVTDIAKVLAACVHQYQLPSLQVSVVSDVVKTRGSGASSYHRREGHPLGSCHLY